jgi:hypothetical protein
MIKGFKNFLGINVWILSTPMDIEKYNRRYFRYTTNKKTSGIAD